MRLAAEIGYRSFDTAQMAAMNVAGDYLRTLDLPRDQPSVVQGQPKQFVAADFLPSVEQSLRDLQMDQVDMLLLHWPDQHGERAALNQLDRT